MKRYSIIIGIFCAFCTRLLYGDSSYTTSISILQTNNTYLISWLANTEKDSFVLRGSQSRIDSLGTFLSAAIITQLNIRGTPLKNLYSYEILLDTLEYPYLCIQPLKENYNDKDILLGLNSLLFPLALSKPTPSNIVTQNILSEEKIPGVTPPLPLSFQLRGSVLENRFVLSWLYDGWENHSFTLYRFTTPPQEFMLRSTPPLAILQETTYEDTPPVGGPYYYVILQDKVIQLEDNNILGPVWFPRPPITNQTQQEEKNIIR
ncbi:hypothetical protein [Thermospira aquatica]|uniref:Uncharacterized protein n=1 Tax=Thermospira aquatica TaxID=2828656 RepID=A0AAX3BIA8_9SPIR|nr:hypothetical protein [Thermospira aquatica]URA11101.1 hypothetical protein KDW03_04710 [Thermospira aquatica]